MENWNEWYEERQREDYDEWAGKTVPAEDYNEALYEIENLKDEISRLEEDLRDAKSEIKNLMVLLKEIDKEILRLDKLKK